ncbi:MAG: hypothetical protein V4646_06060 [Pseudomonadota bacterium]
MTASAKVCRKTCGGNTRFQAEALLLYTVIKTPSNPAKPAEKPASLHGRLKAWMSLNFGTGLKRLAVSHLKDCYFIDS